MSKFHYIKKIQDFFYKPWKSHKKMKLCLPDILMLWTINYLYIICIFGILNPSQSLDRKKFFAQMNILKQNFSSRWSHSFINRITLIYFKSFKNYKASERIMESDKNLQWQFQCKCYRLFTIVSCHWSKFWNEYTRICDYNFGYKKYF